MKPYKLIISGGGTGGHIFPAVAIALEIKKRHAAADILFVGALGKMEMEKVPKAGFPIQGLWISGFQRSLSLQNLLFPFKVIFSLLRSYQIVKTFAPDAVIGTGGFASGPVLQVAQWLKKPTLIQEQNSYPGITNRILSKKVSKICVAFQGMERFFPASKTILTGNPIRPLDVDKNPSTTAKSFFGLDPNKKTVVVLGGSLGAQRINDLIAQEKEFMQSFGLQILWQCGTRYYEKYKGQENENVFIRPFVQEMDQLYAAADFIISRAGAGSLSELSCVGKPLLLIPSPNVTANHQVHNANALAQQGAAFLIEESNLDAYQKIFSQWVTDMPLQAQMKKQLKTLAKPKAAEAIVDEILKMITR
ncbi:MAG: undecaprenyldiphospho-muramoylpentapeptide beta-N-acetylglucosaminyltransferase [Flavobacteriia bacterium]|nr:undecaprenyldiphospho-muramoylpentapeptide beta-N-acetylglucosaminyltransferase [Flavobacteriia bacterium]